MIARDGLSEAEATARLAAQWPIAEKVGARAAMAIRTDGDFRDGVRIVRHATESSDELSAHS